MLQFVTSLCFILSNEGLLVHQNYRPGKKKYVIFDPIELAMSYIIMLTSYEPPLEKKVYLISAIIKMRSLKSRKPFLFKRRTKQMVRLRWRDSLKTWSSSSRVYYLSLRTYFSWSLFQMKLHQLAELLTV